MGAPTFGWVRYHASSCVCARICIFPIISFLYSAFVSSSTPSQGAPAPSSATGPQGPQGSPFSAILGPSPAAVRHMLAPASLLQKSIRRGASLCSTGPLQQAIEGLQVWPRLRRISRRTASAAPMLVLPGVTSPIKGVERLGHRNTVLRPCCAHAANRPKSPCAVGS